MSDEYVHIGAPPTEPQQAPPVPRKRRKRWPWGVAVAAVLAIASGVAVVGLYVAPQLTEVLAQTITVRGTVTLIDDKMSFRNGNCVGRGGYDDIYAGAQVVVSDASGKTVGLGELEGGTPSNGNCVFSFAVKDVPRGIDFYGVTVGNRKGMRFTEADVAQPLALSLGG